MGYVLQQLSEVTWQLTHDGVWCTEFSDLADAKDTLAEAGIDDYEVVPLN